jgi:hypothetical protein
MATFTITPTQTFISGDTVLPATLNQLALSNVALTAGTIVEADIAAGAVTNAKLASGIDASKLTTGTLPIARVADGAVTNAKVADGAVVQVVSSTVATVTAVSAVIPSDDTVPQSTEGFELLTATITPNSSTNKVLVQFSGFCASPNTGFAASHVLFRGSTAINAMATSHSVANAFTPVFIQHLDAPASGSALTYSVRVGPSLGTVNLAYNSNGGTRRFGGAASAVLTLTEIKAS